MSSMLRLRFGEQLTANAAHSPQLLRELNLLLKARARDKQHELVRIQHFAKGLKEVGWQSGRGLCCGRIGVKAGDADRLAEQFSEFFSDPRPAQVMLTKFFGEERPKGRVCFCSFPAWFAVF
jgi:hypothetical protein